MGVRKRIKLKLSIMLDLKLKARTRPRTYADIILDQMQLRKEINQLNRLNNE